MIVNEYAAGKRVMHVLNRTLGVIVEVLYVGSILSCRVQWDTGGITLEPASGLIVTNH